MTLNYMSSVWMALFLLGGAVHDGHRQKLDWRLDRASVLLGFVGVALILQPDAGPAAGSGTAWPVWSAGMLALPWPICR